MRYNPNRAPNQDEWFALDEAERIELVSAHHQELRVELPNAPAHAAIHVIVENQLAEGVEVVRDTLDRLLAEGLNRHDTIHAIGSVLAEHMRNLMQKGSKTPHPTESYFQALRCLTSSSWIKGRS